MVLMKLGNPKLLHDLYEWLPVNGESKVDFRSSGTDVIIEVIYEKELDDGEEQTFKREIVFKSVHVFINSLFPGFSMFEFDSKEEFGYSWLRALSEYPDSELIAKNINTGLYDDAVLGRHFTVQFLCANVAFHVLASDVVLLEEVLLG